MRKNKKKRKPKSKRYCLSKAVYSAKNVTFTFFYIRKEGDWRKLGKTFLTKVYGEKVRLIYKFPSRYSNFLDFLCTQFVDSQGYQSKAIDILCCLIRVGRDKKLRGKSLAVLQKEAKKDPACNRFIDDFFTLLENANLENKGAETLHDLIQEALSEIQ